MEEVDDDLVNFDALLLILAGDAQNLILCAVAELTLPKSHQILGEHLGPPRDSGVVFENQLRRICHGDPVIHFFCGTGSPFGIVFAEGHMAHGGIVPQKAVTQRRDGKGNGDLGIALGKLQHAALQIQTVLLILSHAENLFLFIAFKFDVQAVLASADHALPFPVHYFQAPAFP